MSFGSAGLPVTSASVLRQGRIGLGREQHGHNHLAGGNRRRFHAYARGQFSDSHVHFTTKIGAVAQHQDRLAIAFGDRDRHDAGSERNLFGIGRHGECGRDARQLDPVSVIRPSLSKLVDEPDHVFCCFGCLEPEVAVGPDRVVRRQQGASAFLAEVHHRIKRRPDPTGVAMNVVNLPLGCLEHEVIDVAGFFDHAVQRHRRLERRGVRVDVIWLLLDHVTERS